VGAALQPVTTTGRQSLQSVATHGSKILPAGVDLDRPGGTEAPPGLIPVASQPQSRFPCGPLSAFQAEDRELSHPVFQAISSASSTMIPSGPRT
jgi:hypothetical protein